MSNAQAFCFAAVWCSFSSLCLGWRLASLQEERRLAVEPTFAVCLSMMCPRLIGTWNI